MKNVDLFGSLLVFLSLHCILARKTLKLPFYRYQHHISNACDSILFCGAIKRNKCSGGSFYDEMQIFTAGLLGPKTGCFYFELHSYDQGLLLRRLILFLALPSRGLQRPFSRFGYRLVGKSILGWIKKSGFWYPLVCSVSKGYSGERI